MTGLPGDQNPLPTVHPITATPRDWWVSDGGSTHRLQGQGPYPQKQKWVWEERFQGSAEIFYSVATGFSNPGAHQSAREASEGLSLFSEQSSELFFFNIPTKGTRPRLRTNVFCSLYNPDSVISVPIQAKLATFTSAYLWPTHWEREKRGGEGEKPWHTAHIHTR